MKKALLPSLLLLAWVVAAPPLAAVIPTGFSDVVVYGTNSVAFGNGAVVVSGDVVVNDSATAPTLEANREFAAEKDAVFPAGYEVKADRLKAHKDTVFNGTVFCNTLDASGNPVTCSPLALPVFAFLPPFVNGPSNGPDVDVARNGELDLSPGDYGVLTVGQTAIVRFTGGVYNFRSIDAKKGAALVFLAPSELRVAEGLNLERDGTFGPAAGSGVAASEIVAYVAGAGIEGDPVLVATFDANATIGANVYAAAGVITIGSNSVASGAFVGFDVRVEDGAELTLDTYFFNRPPVAGDDSATVAEGGTVSTLDSGETSLLANDSDPDGDNLAVTTTPVVFPAHGAVVLNADGTFVYTHDGSETLSDSFVYEVCDDGTDPGPLCDTATVAITVLPVNDPPVANPDSATVDEGGTVTLLDGGAASVLANDTDAENGVLTASLVSGPANASAFALNPDGTFSYTHDGSETTSDGFDYQVCDDGTDPGPLCDTATVAITVLPVNDPPVANDDSATVDEGGTVTVLDGGAASVLANDVDPDGPNLTASLVGGPANASAFALNPDGTFSYTHDGSETTSDGFSYEVCDNGTPNLCDTAAVAITVNPVNDPPVANPDSATVDEGGTVTLLDGGAASVLANDTDAENGVLTASLVSGPANASAFALNPDGTFSYTHDGSETTSDGFDYQACDDGTPVECDTATVTITVNPVNDPPVAVDDSATVEEGGTVTVLDSGATSVLANDTDPDGPSLTATLTGGLNAASAFTLNPNGTFSYSHDGGGATSDFFTYEVCDNGTPNLCDDGRVDIAITQLSLTQADPQSTSTSVDVPVIITLTGVAEPEDLPLVFSIVSPPSNGSVTSPTTVSDTSANVTYSPALGFEGDDQFTFQVEDNKGVTDTAVVTIQVIDESGSETVNAFDVSLAIDEGTPVTVTLSATTTSEDPVTFAIATSPSNGTLGALVPDAGSISATVDYTPNAGFTGVDSFTYDACIPAGCDTGTVTITVRPVSITVTITKAGDGGGTVSSIPEGIDCGLVCSAGFTGEFPIQLFAEADEGSVFSGWSGDADCADGRLTPNADKSCTATFELEGPPPVGEVTISVAISGTGTGRVTSSPAGIDCGVICSATFDAFTRVELDPVADPGSEFVGWGGTGDCLDGQLNTDRNQSCIAFFDALPAETFTLTVVKLGAGSGTVVSSPAGISCGGDCSEGYVPGTEVRLSTRPDSGSTFVGWGGDCSGTSFFTTVTLDADKTCTATYN